MCLTTWGHAVQPGRSGEMLMIGAGRTAKVLGSDRQQDALSLSSCKTARQRWPSGEWP